MGAGFPCEGTSGAERSHPGAQLSELARLSLPGAGVAEVFSGSSAISGRCPRYLRAISATLDGYGTGNSPGAAELCFVHTEAD